MIKPITPDVLTDREFPDFVIKAFNDCISEKYSCGRASVFIKDVVLKIIKYAGPILTEKCVYNSGYLNIEEIYENYGWNVKYVSPEYTESFDPYYIFTKK